MVCRENKGRSAIMGLHKALADLDRHAGEVALTDNEYQSAIHDAGHMMEGHKAMTVPEQIEMWKGIRQLVANNNGIPEATKYRESHGRGGQPGIVTRIDQEIARLETGKSESGKPLTNAQINHGNQLAAVQRLGVLLQRATPAKQRYLETYARHTGKTVKQAQAEWNALMSRDGDFSNVSLTDGFRDQLAVAGLSSQAQADIGQSGKTRDTLKIMEQRRMEALAAQPTRETPITDSVAYVKPDQVGETQQCIGEGGCGRFGHTRDVCPNQAALAEVDELTTQAQQDYRVAEMWDTQCKLDQWETDGPPNDAAVANARTYLAGLADASGIDPDTLTSKQAAQAQARYSKSEQRTQELNDQMDAAQPRVSAAVQKLEYNRNTGMLVVTAHPYTRKGDGKVCHRSYAYRVSEAEYERLAAAESVGSAINESVWRKGKLKTPTDGFKYENAADEAAAFTQTQCPTCGQWASMNSGHRCPLNGAPRRVDDFEPDSFDGVEEDNRTAAAKYRAQFRQAVADNTALPVKAGQTKLVIGSGQMQPLGKAVQGSMAAPVQVSSALSEGRTVRTPVKAAFPDGTVEGTVTVWNDESGTSIVSGAPEAGGRGLSCNCADYRHNGACKHLGATLAIAQHRWGVDGRSNDPTLTPRTTLANFKAGVAQDAPAGELERTDYVRIVATRAEATAAQRAAFNKLVDAGGHVAGPRTQPPLDVSSGEPVGWPTRWARSDGTGAPVDLADSGEVQQRLRVALFSRDRQHWGVYRDPDGGMRIAVPPKRRLPDGTCPGDERARLAGMLGVPVSAVGQDGYRIPPDSSWRHDALDRAYGDQRRIEPASWVV